MAEDSWPKSTRNGGTLNDMEHELLVSAVQPSGLIGATTDTAVVYADGTGTRTIKIRPQKYGLARGKLWYSGTVEYTKQAAANTSGSTRTDLVVLRLDRATWATTLEIRQGTPGAGAAPAPVQTITDWDSATGVFEVPAATITVVNNATTFAAGDVKPIAWYVLPDGSIQCTDTTRPYGSGILMQGLAITETNTKFRRFWNGSGWAYFPGTLVAKSPLRTVNVGLTGIGETATPTDSVSFDAVANQPFTVKWSGSWQANGGAENSELRVRSAAGPAVTSAGSLLKGVQVTSSAGGINVPIELTVNGVTFAAGQTTIGMFLANTFGPGTHTLVGTPNSQSDIAVYAA